MDRFTEGAMLLNDVTQPMVRIGEDIMRCLGGTSYPFHAWSISPWTLVNVDDFWYLYLIIVQ